METLVLWVLVAPPLSCAQPQLELKPFSYHEGFEKDTPPVQLWAKNGNSQVKFLGVTENESFEGRRCLKLDVILKGGSYHYWGVPVRVPCEGRLKMSARIRLGKETSGARIMIYPEFSAPVFIEPDPGKALTKCSKMGPGSQMR